jgi:hypothetical protein
MKQFEDEDNNCLEKKWAETDLPSHSANRRSELLVLPGNFQEALGKGLRDHVGPTVLEHNPFPESSSSGM